MVRKFCHCENNMGILTATYWLAFIVNLTPTGGTWEDGTSSEELPTLEHSVALSVGHFLDCLTWEIQAYCRPGLYKKSSST